MIVLTSRPAMIVFFRFAIYAPFNGDGNASGCSPEAFSMLLNHQFSMPNSGIASEGIQKSCIMSGPPAASLRDAIKYACASTEGENDHPRASETIRAFSPSTVSDAAGRHDFTRVKRLVTAKGQNSILIYLSNSIVPCALQCAALEAL